MTKSHFGNYIFLEWIGLGCYYSGSEEAGRSSCLRRGPADECHIKSFC